jgi:stage III sporulation protein AG
VNQAVGKLSQWMEQWFGNGPKTPQRGQVIRWVLIVGLVGAALMILNSFIHVKQVDPAVGSSLPQESHPPANQTFMSGSNKETSKFREYEEAYENQLKQILETIVGVGDVEVLVTIDSTEVMDVARNSKDTQQVTGEKDTNGATRNITEVTRDGSVVLYQVSSDQQPLVLKYIKPKIRGVIVVAKGAENMTVKKMISEAVERGLDVPPHKISILPRKQS